MKNYILSYIGIIGGAIISFLGGWSTALETLIIFMAIDYITGIMVAGIFKKSTKTEGGSLKSIAGFKGICKKVSILLCVAMAYHLDKLTGTNFVHSAVIIAYCINEGISIIENFGLMGFYIPNQIKNAIDVLQKGDALK